MNNEIALSIPFLATKSEQIVKHIGNKAVEAVVFNYEDLLEDSWHQIWKSINYATELYEAKNVTFHFPVNQCDYTENTWIRNRLSEALARANDLGLAGLVVHSNRIRNIAEWKHISLVEEREKVIDTLTNIYSKSNKHTWLALENMPVMDNNGVEIDPLFCFPNDFLGMMNTEINIVWDICHYANTLSNIQQVIDGIQNQDHYPNFQTSNLLDFIQLKDKIVHWHFSAFRGIANPDSEEKCYEGCLPYESTISENSYKNAFNSIKKINSKRFLVLEIQEENYLDRINTKKMIEWIRAQEENYAS